MKRNLSREHENRSCYQHVKPTGEEQMLILFGGPGNWNSTVNPQTQWLYRKKNTTYKTELMAMCLPRIWASFIFFLMVTCLSPTLFYIFIMCFNSNWKFRVIFNPAHCCLQPSGVSCSWFFFCSSVRNPTLFLRMSLATFNSFFSSSISSSAFFKSFVWSQYSFSLLSKDAFTLENSARTAFKKQNICEATSLRKEENRPSTPSPVFPILSLFLPSILLLTPAHFSGCSGSSIGIFH